MTCPLQLEMPFGDPTVRWSDPDTSHEAAEDAAVSANKGREIALATLRRHPAGLTDHELAAITGWQLNSMNKRRGELRDRGFVYDTGTRRRTPSGSSAIVWKAREEWHQQLIDLAREGDEASADALFKDGVK